MTNSGLLDSSVIFKVFISIPASYSKVVYINVAKAIINECNVLPIYTAIQYIISAFIRVPVYVPCGIE